MVIFQGQWLKRLISTAVPPYTRTYRSEGVSDLDMWRRFSALTRASHQSYFHIYAFCPLSSFFKVSG